MDTADKASWRNAVTTTWVGAGQDPFPNVVHAAEPLRGPHAVHELQRAESQRAGQTFRIPPRQDADAPGPQPAGPATTTACREAVDVAGLTQSVGGRLRQRRPGSRTTIRWQNEPDLPYAFADRVLLGRFIQLGLEQRLAQDQTAELTIALSCDGDAVRCELRSSPPAVDRPWISGLVRHALTRIAGLHASPLWIQQRDGRDAVLRIDLPLANPASIVRHMLTYRQRLLRGESQHVPSQGGSGRTVTTLVAAELKPLQRHALLVSLQRNPAWLSRAARDGTDYGSSRPDVIAQRLHRSTDWVLPCGTDRAVAILDLDSPGQLDAWLAASLPGQQVAGFARESSRSYADALMPADPIQRFDLRRWREHDRLRDAVLALCGQPAAIGPHTLSCVLTRTDSVRNAEADPSSAASSSDGGISGPDPGRLVARMARYLERRPHTPRPLLSRRS